MKTGQFATWIALLAFGALVGTMASCSWSVDTPILAQEHLGAPESLPLKDAERDLEYRESTVGMALAQYREEIAEVRARRTAVNGFLFGIAETISPLIEQVTAALGPAGAPVGGAVAIGLPALLGAFGIRKPGDVSKKEARETVDREVKARVAEAKAEAASLAAAIAAPRA